MREESSIITGPGPSKEHRSGCWRSGDVKLRGSRPGIPKIAGGLDRSHKIPEHLPEHNGDIDRRSRDEGTRLRDRGMRGCLSILLEDRHKCWDQPLVTPVKG
nr:uncharacterized protein LOC117601228 isoform X2 [Osmia lignaria]